MHILNGSALHAVVFQWHTQMDVLPFVLCVVLNLLVTFHSMQILKMSSRMRPLWTKLQNGLEVFLHVSPDFALSVSMANVLASSG